jgi:hypothetical protein
MVLSGFKCPLEAGVSDVTATAHLLGLLDLEQGRASVPYREEQLRILIKTGSLMAPIHGVITPLHGYRVVGGPRKKTKTRVVYTDRPGTRDKTFKYRRSTQDLSDVGSLTLSR